MVNSWVFKDDESESEVKTNSGPRVCPLLVKGPHFACVVYAQCPLLAHCVSTYMYTHTHLYVISPHRVNLNFLTHFTGKGVEPCTNTYVDDGYLVQPVQVCVPMNYQVIHGIR